MSENSHIAFLSLNQFNPYLADGVSRAMLELLLFLKRHDHSVSILNFMTSEPHKRQFISQAPLCADVDHQQMILGLEERQIPQKYQVALQAMLSRIEPEGIDFAFTVDQGILPLFCAWYLGIPGAHFLHSVRYARSFTRDPLSVKLLQTRTVFVNSQFLQTKVKDLLNLDAVVWYPLGAIRDFRASRSEDGTGAIGFYSGGRHKGDAIINRVVSRMPDRVFLVVGRNYSPPPGQMPPNLRFWDDIRDMRRFYSRIGLLLVPSLSEEGFSRVILEAAVNGIPVIANRVGGIPEALGNSGVLVDVDLGGQLNLDAVADEYVREIDRLLSDDSLYRSYRQRAIARACEYEETQARRARELYEEYILEAAPRSGL